MTQSLPVIYNQSKAGCYQQRGSVSLMLAVSFTLLAFCLVMALDVGRLYMQRQQVQNIADLVAMELGASTELHKGRPIQSQLQTRAYENRSAVAAGFHGGSDDRELIVAQGHVRVLEGGRWDFSPGVDDNGQMSAVRVEARHTVPRSIIFDLAALLPGVSNDPLLLRAEAVAHRPMQTYTAFSAGTTLLTVCDAGDALLCAVLQEMLGTGVNLALLSSSGVLDSSITLLELAEGLGLVDFDLDAVTRGELLSTSVTAAELVSASISALGDAGLAAQVSALQDLLDNASDALSLEAFQLSDILSINEQLLKDVDALEYPLTIGSLLSAGVFAANRENGVSLSGVNASLDPLVTVGLDLGIIEPPRIAVGPPGCINRTEKPPCGSSGWMTEVTTAHLKLDLSLTTQLLGVVSANVGLSVDAGSGHAALATVLLADDVSSVYDVGIEGSTSFVDISPSLSLEVLPLLEGVLTLKVNGTGTTDQRIETINDVVNLRWPSTVLSVGNLTTRAVGSVVGSVQNTLASVDVELTSSLTLLDLLLSPLNALLTPLLSGGSDLSGRLSDALGELATDVVEPVINPLLEALGIEANSMEVEVLDIRTQVMPTQLVM